MADYTQSDARYIEKARLVRGRSRDAYYIEMAKLVSTRSTCVRRAVGCVLVNARGEVLSTGYNGVAKGQPHCNEEGKTLLPAEFPLISHAGQTALLLSTTHEYPNACQGKDMPAGQAGDFCQSIHAEQNALLQCRNVYEIETAYITDSPCMTCTKLLLNTSCKKVVFAREYPAPLAKGLWLSENNASALSGLQDASRYWEHHKE